MQFWLMSRNETFDFNFIYTDNEKTVFDICDGNHISIMWLLLLI